MKISGNHRLYNIKLNIIYKTFFFITTVPERKAFYPNSRELTRIQLISFSPGTKILVKSLKKVYSFDNN